MQGSFSSSLGSLVCQGCNPGSIASSTGSTVCTACTPGRFMASSGQSACQDCQKGYTAAFQARGRGFDPQSPHFVLVLHTGPAAVRRLPRWHLCSDHSQLGLLAMRARNLQRELLRVHEMLALPCRTRLAGALD